MAGVPTGVGLDLLKFSKGNFNAPNRSIGIGYQEATAAQFCSQYVISKQTQMLNDSTVWECESKRRKGGKDQGKHQDANDRRSWISIPKIEERIEKYCS